MKALTSSEQKYWEAYCGTIGKSPQSSGVEASYIGTKETTDHLLSRFLSGQKTASSSLLDEYHFTGEALPKTGTYWIVLGSDDQPKCILRTIKVMQVKFKNVPLETAVAEGEGDSSLEYWKKTHTDFFSPFLDAWKVKDLNQAVIVTEFFDLVFPGK